MKIEYDPKHNILNIEFLQNVNIEDTDEQEGIIFDYSEDGKIVAIEILDASTRITKSPLETIDFVVLKEKVEA